MGCRVQLNRGIPITNAAQLEAEQPKVVTYEVARAFSQVANLWLSPGGGHLLGCCVQLNRRIPITNAAQLEAKQPKVVTYEVARAFSQVANL